MFCLDFAPIFTPYMYSCWILTDLKTITILTSVCQFFGNSLVTSPDSNWSLQVFVAMCLPPRHSEGSWWTREKKPFQPDVNQFKIQKNCNCATLHCFNTLSISPVCLPAMSMSLGFCAPKSGWSSTWETHGARKISWSQRRKIQCENMRNCLKPEDMKDCQMSYTSLVCCWFSLRNLLCFTCPTQTHACEQETRQMFGNDANSDFRTCQNPNVKHSRKTQLLKPFRTLSIKQITQLKTLNS